MARVALTIADVAGSYFGPRLSWWRRALLVVSRRLERLAYRGVVNWSWWGSAPVGKAVDPERRTAESEPLQ